MPCIGPTPELDCFEENHNLVRYLCAVLTYIEKNNIPYFEIENYGVNTQTKKWWEAHKYWDSNNNLIKMESFSDGLARKEHEIQNKGDK